MRLDRLESGCIVRLDQHSSRLYCEVVWFGLTDWKQTILRGCVVWFDRLEADYTARLYCLV